MFKISRYAIVAVICLLIRCKTATRLSLAREFFVQLIVGEVGTNDARSRRLFSIKCKISRGQGINCIPIRSGTKSESGRI